MSHTKKQTILYEIIICTDLLVMVLVATVGPILASFLKIYPNYYLAPLYSVSFFEGIIDAYAAYKYGMMVCRHTNIITALTFNKTDVYLIYDSTHLRTAVLVHNKTLVIIDKTCPECSFKNSSVLVVTHCHVKYLDTVYTKCNIVHISINDYIEYLYEDTRDPLIKWVIKYGVLPMNNSITIVRIP